ncbi:hypothetical protein [Herbidospora sp. NBRC 101105]|uniref:hypothetical protein n=1 Tax=Herbidospora sp. NBRC 101105 TaxID=3032195 RepID=UPI0024A44FC3|nr:hypothetical protein [Herbidospora sp. NBRC 101105]GLX97554.1 hypothetical protein Hesp01_55040 [Herbidospora sp. NBRC 101105]
MHSWQAEVRKRALLTLADYGEEGVRTGPFKMERWNLPLRTMGDVDPRARDAANRFNNAFFRVENHGFWKFGDRAAAHHVFTCDHHARRRIVSAAALVAARCDGVTGMEGEYAFRAVEAPALLEEAHAFEIRAPGCSVDDPDRVIEYVVMAYKNMAVVYRGHTTPEESTWRETFRFAELAADRLKRAHARRHLIRASHLLRRASHRI